MEPLMQIFTEMVFGTPILYLLIGAAIGIIIGALPGLSATMGVALLLPLTFGMEPIEGISMLMGVYVGGVSGGLISATLLRMPGTPSSVATTFDAYPMAQRGEAARALGIGITASLIGGLLSFVALVTIAPMIARAAVKLSSFEFFSLTVFALTLIAVLSQGNVFKGVASGLLGILFACVGFAPIDGTQRFTFGSLELSAGIGLLPLIIGLFAVSEILRTIVKGEEKMETLKVNLRVRGLGFRLAELIQNGWNILRSSVIGIAIGILPGIGGSVSNLVAYAQAKQASKKPETFGKGNPEGVWASESANNASIGGALIPMMTLGIPGDGVTAMLLGGLIIHGIQPGPLLFKTNADIVYIVYWSFLLGSILVFLMQIFGMRTFPLILSIPKRYLYSILLVLAVVGSYVNDNRLFEVWVMLFFGLVGFILEEFDVPLGPLLLGFVLAPFAEVHFRRAVMYSGGDLTPFLTRPVSALFLALAVLMLVYFLVKGFRSKKTNPEGSANGAV